MYTLTIVWLFLKWDQKVYDVSHYP